MEKKNATLLALVLVLGLLAGGMFVKYTMPLCNNDISSPADTIASENNDGDKSEDTNITYATFSSSKADFTFEYPDTWVHDENELNNTMVWRFYSKSADNHDSIPYLEVHSPIDDPGAVGGFPSGAPDLEKGEPLRPYHNFIYVFSTNDPSTFVTYQWGGSGELKNGSGRIYWEKGQYFADSSSLSGHNKYNYMRVYSIPEKGQEVGLHIAQSIKVK
ncbi:MAG: hypothetical protein WCQ96_04665 [Patescibacteria group bacterium]